MMKVLAGIFIFLLAWPALAAEKMRTVSIDGKPYIEIQDVQIANGGRIVILFASGGTSVAADKLPSDFLASWGITPEALAASKAVGEKQAEQALIQAIRTGFFREVDGVVYDLRKPQTGWRQFSNAKILQVVEDGALVEPDANEATPTAVFVRNLPKIYADNDKAAFKAKLVGNFTYANKFGYERTIHAYDVGRVCPRSEIPEGIIHGGLASARLPLGDRPKEQERPAVVLPGGGGLRGIGSGFFISSDGGRGGCDQRSGLAEGLRHGLRAARLFPEGIGRFGRRGFYHRLSQHRHARPRAEVHRWQDQQPYRHPG
jgi:hypothetical protein